MRQLEKYIEDEYEFITEYVQEALFCYVGDHYIIVINENTPTVFALVLVKVKFYPNGTNDSFSIMKTVYCISSENTITDSFDTFYTNAIKHVPDMKPVEGEIDEDLIDKKKTNSLETSFLLIDIDDD